MKRCLKKTISICLICSIMFTFVFVECPTFAATTDIAFDATKKEALNETLAGIAEEYNVTGMSLAVFQDQDIVYQYANGLARKEEEIPATTETIYRTASIAKIVTSLLVMTLEEKKLLKLEDSVSKLLGINVDLEGHENEITVQQLMTHTSGIADTTAYYDALDEDPYPSLEGLLESGSIHTGAAPGQQYSYSSLSIGLLCAVIEKVSGKKFYQYAEDTLFKPLGIDAGFYTNLIEDTDKLANIYMGGSLSLRFVDSPAMAARYREIPLGQMYLLGHGNLYIKAKDLAKIGILLAGDGTYQGKKILEPATVKKMNQVVYQEEEDSIYRGLGLQITRDVIPGVTLYGHQGNAYGMVGCLFYDPTKKMGISFLTNGCRIKQNDAGIYTINQAIFSVFADEFLGIKVVEVSPALLAETGEKDKKRNRT